MQQIVRHLSNIFIWRLNQLNRENRVALYWIPDLMAMKRHISLREWSSISIIAPEPFCGGDQSKFERIYTAKGKMKRDEHCTYIIGHYNPSVRIPNQLIASFMLCALILCMSSGTYNLKSTPNNRFLRSFSWQFFLLPEFLPEIC